MAILYEQRLWDTGSGGRYVYYTKAAVDPTPTAPETTPNYTGVISSHSIVRITGSADPVVSGNVLWRWNGIDGTQLGNIVVSGGMDSGSFSVVQRENGPALRLTAQRTGATNGLIAAAITDGLVLPERYIVKFRMREASGVVCPDWAGAEIFSNGLAGAARFGCCAFSDKNGNPGTAGVTRIIEAGVFSGGDWVTFNSGPFDDASTEQGGLFSYHVAMNRQTTKPEGSVYHVVHAGSQGIDQEKFEQGDFPSGSWVPTDCTTVGIGFRGLGVSSGLDMAVDFSDLVIEAVDLT